MIPSLALLSVLTGCTDPDPDLGLPDWTDGDPGGDTGDTNDTVTLEGGEMSIVVEMPGVDTRLGQVGAPDADCVLDPTGSAYETVDCQLEVNELDLYFQGWAYQVRVPSGTCEYLGFEHYLYEAWHHGDGPTEVEIEVDTEGRWVADVQNAVGGEPACEYDYSDEGGPNCCYGSYTLTTVVVDDTGAEVDRFDSPPRGWDGGPIGDCYAGAAFKASETQIDPATGLPRYVIVDIDEDIDNAYAVSFTAPIEKPESTNVTLASYYDPADPIPAGLLGPHARDHYAVECLDRAFEIRARFELTVREWDEKREFEADGDPDSGMQSAPGAEPPLEANGSGSPINDHWDWADFALNGIDYVKEAD